MLLSSPLYIPSSLSCHWGIEGGSGFNHDRVIIFLAINNRRCNRYSFFFSHFPLRSALIMWNLGVSGKSTFNIESNSLWIPYQWFFNFGQSQNMCVWSLIWWHSLQHKLVLLLSNMEVMEGFWNISFLVSSWILSTMGYWLFYAPPHIHLPSTYLW